MVDNINPSHYKNSCSLECIDTMFIAFGYEYVYYYCLINAYKYLWRYKNKNGKEDIDKAEWYLNEAQDIYNTHENASLNYVKLMDMFDLLSKVKEEIRPKKVKVKEEEFVF